MIDIDSVDTESRLALFLSIWRLVVVSHNYHPRPLPVFEILLCSPPYALRFMETEKTVVELAYNVFRRKEVVEHPLLPELLDVGTKYGNSVRTEIAGLVNSDEHVFQLQRFELEVAWSSEGSERCGIQRMVRIPCDGASV